MVVEIEMTVLTDSPDAVARAMDAMSRCAAGLALDRMSVTLSAEEVDEVTEDEDEEADSV